MDVVGGYARLVATGTANRWFGIAGSDKALFMDVARLNIGGDKVVEAGAVKASFLKHRWLSAERRFEFVRRVYAEHAPLG